jgi:hypothetical protein
LAVCESRTPTSGEVSRQLAKVAAIQLNASDLRTLIAALALFKEQFQPISDQRSQLGANATGQFTALQAAEANLVAATRANLQAGLSPGGWAALDHYIQTHVKQHIKVYTEPGTGATGEGGN